MHLNTPPYFDDLVSQVKERLSLLQPAIDPPMVEKEAAAFLNSSCRTLQRWRQTGEGPAYHRVGKRRVVYYRADLITWLERRRHVSTSAEGYRRKRAA